MFWEENRHKQWCFKSEIIKHCKQQTELLAKSCLTFLKQSFELQERIKTIEKMKSRLILHPFAKGGCNSRSSFTFNIHKVYYLNKYNLETVMFEKTSNMKKVSRDEYQYCSYKALTEPENDWIHAFNCKTGQKKFGNFHVDLYSEKLNTVVQYNGCVYHAHEPCGAKVNENRTPTTKNFCGKTFDEQKAQDQKFRDFMHENHPDVILEEVNACDWRLTKREKDPENKKSMWFNFKRKHRDEYWDKRPLNRLIPREAIRGGGLEVYNLKFDREENDNEDIFFCDINSLYSHVAMNTQFGIGHCEVLVDPKDIKEYVYWNHAEEQFYYKQFPLQGGAALCNVIVPESDQYPFLPYRINNFRTVMACCRTCAEQNLTATCKHKKGNRMFTGSWMISTLNQLASEGYTIEWLEIHYFPKKAFILKDYVQMLCSERLKNSGLISSSMSTEQQQLICDEINKVMKLPDHLKLTPSKCVNNPQQKQFYKDFMNCLFGMFSRNTGDVKTKMCQSQTQINNIAQNYLIENLNTLSKYYCSVDYRLNSNAIPPNLDSNIYIGGEVSSQGFVELRKHMLTIIECGGTPLMIDTDAIVFKLPKNVPNPLKIGSAVGLWKHEYTPGSIEKIYALASRNYSVCFSDQNNVLKQVLKVRGLCLKTSLNQNVLSSDTFKNFISDHFQDKFKSIKVLQTKRFRVLKSFQYDHRVSGYNFCNNLTNKRFLLTNGVDETYRDSILKTNSDVYQTYPFGYKMKMN